MSESQFDQEKAKLRGMNEMEMKIDIPSQFSDEASIKTFLQISAELTKISISMTLHLGVFHQ